MPNFKNGFTLIEVLVSITIVGIIFGIVINSAASIQRSSRDAQREADLKLIQSALQQFYADHQYFPKDSLLATVGNGLNSVDSTKRYMEKIPGDPLTSNPYCYQSKVSFSSSTACTLDADRCHYYALWANLENSTASTTTVCGRSYNKVVNPL